MSTSAAAGIRADPERPRQRADDGALLPIVEIGRQMGLAEDDLDLYGKHKAKIHLDVRDRLADRPNGKYIAVTAITPTALGEGKTVVAIGLADALRRLGHTAIACLRQPSLAPTFGLKGGGAGGGAARVEPFADVNLHLTGDIHAVGAAHNLLAAALDAHLFHGNALQIDPYAIMLKRVLDVDDRVLRHVVVGLGGREDGAPRQTGFEVTAASEVMAILALSTDLNDLRARLGRMVVALARDGAPITAEAMRVAGAMAALLKDALLPNLLQTAERTPVFVHTGPFGNIAHGNSSIVADQIALKAADYVVTESGFGADLGLEKFVDIKCRASGLVPDCVVLVATVRALKAHGGAAGAPAAGTARPGPAAPALGHPSQPPSGTVLPTAPPLPPGWPGNPLAAEDLPALERGCANLARQIANARLCGVPVVVAINRFPADTPAEVALVRQQALRAGAESAHSVTVWADGGAGGAQLAAAVVSACARPKQFRLLYQDDLPIKEKIGVIAAQVYGAAGVQYLPAAECAIERLTELGLARLPVCMAKTHLSLSHDPKRLGAPAGYRLPVRDVQPATGAGFLYALCGDVRTMPGLPARPSFEGIDLVDGRIVGLA